MGKEKDSVLVIGAGIGGLASAIRLVSAGVPVTLLEAHDWPGGKMRCTPSPAGPVDAGPTVLTMRAVFDDLFACAGSTLEDHLTLTPLPVIARHFWQGGARLDLFADPAANRDAIDAAFGARAAEDFARFDDATRALYQAFTDPVMMAPHPSVLASARAALGQPRLLPWLRPGLTLDAALSRAFAEPRLRQLFGRYATYVGGNPLRAPALLALVWQAEAAGVWAVQGGMARLAQALAGLFTSLGGELRLQSPVAALMIEGGAVAGARLTSGEELRARQVIFNGDPAALPALTGGHRAAPPRRAFLPRSLSAHVFTGAAQVQPDGLGQDALAYHTVFFADERVREFTPLARGLAPQDPTIYVCAQDRARGLPAPGAPERFQFILNAPALADSKDIPCPTDPFQRLQALGLTMHPQGPVLTGPAGFARLFPHSRGALYGLSPDSAMASFLRPVARARLRGLYLAGGGVHPGPGLPMAALSGRHAAEALLGDLISHSAFRPTAMPGGMSTASATTAPAPSR